MEEQAELWGLPTEKSLDSSCSTPFQSVACSPRSSTDRAASCCFSVCTPACPVRVTLDIRSSLVSGMGSLLPSSDECFHGQLEDPASDDFDFSARFSEADQPWSPAPMSSADELFCNGQIRPLWDNRNDLVYLYAANSKPSDDDDHFDFRSSADYKFTMCSAPDSPASAMNRLQKYAGYGYHRSSCDDGFLRARGMVSKEYKEDATGNRDEQGIKASMYKSIGNLRQGDADSVSKQAMMGKVEESRGRRTASNKEGGIRRARSLSPLRVFHMDDELPGQSFDAGRSFDSSKGDSAVEMDEEQEIRIARMKGLRSTLKELLHASDQADRSGIFNGIYKEKQEKRSPTERKMKERSTPWLKSSLKQASDSSRLEVSKHSTKYHSKASMSLHYASQRVHTEQMRQQTLLPYRHGLLGCLGFTSKSYGCIRTFHSKSQGARQSTRHDTKYSSKS